MYNMIKMRYLATLVATLGAGIPQFAAAQTDVSLPSNQASLEELQDALKRSRDRSQTSEPQGNQLLLLRGIRIADAGQERVETPTTGVDLEQVSGLDDPDTAVILNAYIGRPLSKELLAEILQRTNEALAASGRGFTVAYLPEQDVSDGSVLIEVQQARVGQIGVQVQGDGLPPEEYIRLLRIEPGDVLTKDQIDEETEWLNKSNPYRNAVVIAQPGEQVGSTDVNLLVSNRRPYAFSAGYDNGGTRTTGYDRISFTAGMGNLFGTDQQLNYSLSASPNFNNLVSHGLGYVIPLPWRHLLSVNANYSEFKGRVPAPLESEGESSGLNLRYDIFLPRVGSYTHGMYVSFDHKRSDNNLLFSNTPVTNNLTEIYQFVAGYSFALPDEFGSTRLGVNWFHSPGGGSGAASDAAFNASRFGARSDYDYQTITLERLTELPQDWTWNLLLRVQEASGNLLGSEQLVGGGVTAVRGLKDPLAYGDSGHVLRSELNAPLQSMDSIVLPVRLQPYVFYDQARLNKEVLLPGEAGLNELSSWGVGVRASLDKNVSLSLEAAKLLVVNVPGLQADNTIHVRLSYSF